MERENKTLLSLSSAQMPGLLLTYMKLFLSQLWGTFASDRQLGNTMWSWLRGVSPAPGASLLERSPGFCFWVSGFAQLRSHTHHEDAGWRPLCKTQTAEMGLANLWRSHQYLLDNVLLPPNCICLEESVHTYLISKKKDWFLPTSEPCSDSNPRWARPWAEWWSGQRDHLPGAYVQGRASR